MIRGTSLAILALLAVVVLTTVIVSAAPQQQTVHPLSALTLSGVTLVPAFDPVTRTYTATVPYTFTETTITATANTGFATNNSSLGGVDYPHGTTVPLAYGENAISVTVINRTALTSTSYSVTVTRIQPIGLRTILTPTVAPGGTVDVTLLANGDLYGAIGALIETLPAGFSWVAFIPEDFEGTLQLNPDDSQVLRIVLLGNVTEPIPYQLLVDSAITPGIYNLTGVIEDEDKNPFTIVGDTEITVAFPPSVAISTTDLTVGEGSTGTYTVKLNTQPSDEVTVTIVDPTDNTDVTASPASLSFSTTDWATEQTVTVTAAEDNDPLEDTATVTHTVSGGDYDSVTAQDVAVTVTDNDTPGVAVSPPSLTVDEGSSTGTYTVELNTLPTGNVTVAISSNNTDVTTSSTRLTFTTANWSAEQTVTVTAGQDDDAAVDTATVTHNPSGADYGSVDNADLAVTVTDDDTAGVTVSPTSLTITEGSTDTYTVKLDTQPTAQVTVIINDPTDNTDVTTSPARLTFSTSNWATAQTVTVSAARDDDTLEDAATVTHMVSGGDYAGETASSVVVTVTDTSVPGIRLSPTDLTVTEGGTGTYSVMLATIPTANVTVGIVSSSSADATASASNLTFTATTWNTAQRVTVTAVDDRIDEEAETVSLTHTASGGDYGSVTGTVTVTVNDNDTRGVTVTPTSLPINEGDSGTYTVVLGSEPTASVMVTIVDPTIPTDVTADPASLTFSTSNWATEQTVTVRAAEDDDSSQDRATVTHTVSGGDYAGFAASSVAVTVTDNDTPGVAVSPTSLTIDEGSTDTYTVELNTQPSGDVTVAITTNNTDVTASSSDLTFTTTSWGTAQTVTVTAGQDADAANDTATLTHNPSGADYGSVSSATLTVTVTDDETQGVTVSPTSLAIDEGNTGTYTVVLGTQPTATVTIGVADDSAEVNVSPSRLTFSTSNWSTAQAVTVASVEDDVDEETETAMVTHMVNGGDYAGETAAAVTVTVTDDDTREVIVSESSLTIEEGDRVTYTVVLRSAPTADVTIGVSSDTTGVTVSPSSLTFTAGNWSSARVVTVSSTEDRIDEANQTAAVTHMVSGGDYGSVSATGVTVTVTDDDTRGLILSPASLTVAEGDDETYTVKLDSQPTAEVTVSIGSNITDVSVNPATLTFTTSNWASPKAVTATAHQDDIDKDAGVTARLTHDADGGDYGSESDVLVVTVDDNDTRGVTVSESSLTIEEGESSTYTVALMSAPTSDVTIGVSPGNGVSVTSNSLTFTAATWSAAQTVTVSATNDDIDEANRTVSVTHSVSGGDYGSVTATGVTVTVEDNDTRGVMVTPTSLMVNEGDSGTYTVVLGSEPTTSVMVTIVDPTAPTDVTANPASLSFSTTNWATAQTVTVSAAEDADALEDTATVTHTVSGGDYASFAASSVSVTVQDNDVAGVAVSPSSLMMDEDSTDTYTVKLNTQPSGNVTVAITTDNTDVTPSSTSLTFTTSNWNSAQTVTVTAGEDDDAADEMATLTHNPSGGGYNSVSNASLTVTVTDNDTAGVRVFPMSLPIPEGSTGSYSVTLDTQPLGSVTVTPSSDNGDVTVSPASLMFTRTDWGTLQIVTVTARHDGDATNDTATVTHGVSGYGSITTAASVDVTVTDDDTPGVTVSEASLMINEGSTGTYTVVLDTQPAVDVTIEIESDNTEVTTNTSQLRFTMSNWNRAQTVTVTASGDGDDVDDTATISHEVMGYVGVTTADSVAVTVTDNDMPGVTVSEDSLRFDEGGSATYTVVLNTETTGSVTVDVSSDNPEVTATPLRLTFTAGNWSNPQVVTVGADRDGDDEDELAIISHAVSGYGSIITAESVDVTVADLDSAGVTVSTRSLQISEGGMETYTLVLDTEPGGTVTVAIASTNTDVTALPDSLTFTTADWSTAQTVTVSAAEDADSSNDSATLRHTVSDYGSVTSAASVTVAVTDNDSRTIRLPVVPVTPTTDDSTTGGGSSAPTGRDPRFVEGVRALRSVEANAEPGTPVGEPLWAVDPDSTNLAYSLIGADGDEDFFTIDKETGQLRIKAALDYETKRTYNLVVRVRDNQGADTINVTIELTGEPEPAVTPTPQPTAPTPTPQPTASTPQPTAPTPTPQPTASTPRPTATLTPGSTATPTPEPTTMTGTPTPEPTAPPQPTASPTSQPTATSMLQLTATPTPELIATPVPLVAPTVTPVEVTDLVGGRWSGFGLLLLLLLVVALGIWGAVYANRRRRKRR